MEAPTSLQGHISLQRKQLETAKNSVENKKQQIKALETEISKCTGRHQIRRGKDLEEQVQMLKKDIDKLQSGKVLQDFDEQVKPFLQEQERCKDVFRMEDRLGKKVDPIVSKKRTFTGSSSGTVNGGGGAANGSNLMSFMRKKARTDQLLNSNDDINNPSAKTRVVDDYQMIVQNKAPPVHVQSEDICEKCKIPMLLDMEQSILACKKCGSGKRHMDTTANAVAYGEDVEFAAYSYQRTNYFNEYLTMFQAKETNQVSAEDIFKIMEVLWEERKTDKSTITLEKIREIVRKKRMNHIYKQITQIWCRITGNPAPRLTSEQEKRCREMFKALQEPYDRYLPPDRKNFFSYSYCLFKFMQLLGFPQYLKHFTLLKDRPKLAAMDELWKKICDDLDWEYIESPKE